MSIWEPEFSWRAVRLAAIRRRTSLKYSSWKAIRLYSECCPIFLYGFLPQTYQGPSFLPLLCLLISLRNVNSRQLRRLGSAQPFSPVYHSMPLLQDRGLSWSGCL
ncbi:hypothetical protein FA95DRAFT_297289 [Auriscalpium vulgare]|uniref:Uncharacterized protein n=1 Tax=Auriscalpium vulgare TaxID=40419 RepID=A0ACB8RJ45_9AGAM|nr:hypothetical protein FA95DRAFT_297289 [Auriscalpium vulgare]